MNQGNWTPHAWNEAQQRAETYLRALRGTFGAEESALVSEARRAARAQTDLGAHPVTLVMQALFALMPAAEMPASVASVPPMQRVKMLPEPTEFPIHDGLRRLARSTRLLFAGAH